MSPLARPAPAETPLGPEEVREMREHLAFLRRYKDALRLKLNATEDLLVNGQREPSERGVCRHLLGKVDRAVIDHAIEREPLRSDAEARARMLAGAIRLTADVGVLLAYLEALTHVRSHVEAAAAFAEVVQRIDFESLSPTRLGRLLHVLTDTFTDHERVQVLFSLLAAPAFRRAFDAGVASFPEEVAGVVAPLRAVHRRLLEGGATERPALLATGMEQVLCAPDPVLRGYPEALRAGMLELALGSDVPETVADRAVGVLLPSLARSGRLYARLTLRRASQLLQRHADDRARAVLAELQRAQPGLRVAERWLAALDARRLGRVALGGDTAAPGRLAAAFWLDGQRPVWLRTASAADAERLAREARLQADLALPGVAAVVEHGMASGIPYVAVSGFGRPFAPDATLEPPSTLALAAAATRVLHALAQAGVVLPDAALERFLYAPGAGIALTLADLDGARSDPAASATAAHAALAASLARTLVPARVAGSLPRAAAEGLERALDAATDLRAIAAALDRAALLASRET